VQTIEVYIFHPHGSNEILFKETEAFGGKRTSTLYV